MFAVNDHSLSPLPARAGLPGDGTLASGLRRGMVGFLLRQLAGIALVIGAYSALEVYDPYWNYRSLLRGPPQTIATHFDLCARPGQDNCVLSGHSFNYAGRLVVVNGIDTPRRFASRCLEEGVLGERSAMLLRDLLNAGPFEMMSIYQKRSSSRPRDKILRRGGEYFADRLIDAGLARRFFLFLPHVWCP